MEEDVGRATSDSIIRRRRRRAAPIGRFCRSREAKRLCARTSSAAPAETHAREQLRRACARRLAPHYLPSPQYGIYILHPRGNNIFDKDERARTLGNRAREKKTHAACRASQNLLRYIYLRVTLRDAGGGKGVCGMYRHTPMWTFARLVCARVNGATHVRPGDTCAWLCSRHAAPPRERATRNGCAFASLACVSVHEHSAPGPRG